MDMRYFIDFKKPLTHFFTVRLELDHINNGQVLLQLPIWRPGRYEAANYAKNVRHFKISTRAGAPVEYVKVNSSTWKADTSNTDHLVVTYDYFAFKMDAGSSWYDEDQVYINFINCLVYDAERLNGQCTVTLDLPDSYQMVCGLTRQGNELTAKDYYELVDSPLMAAAALEHYQYEVGSHSFHIWINGRHAMDVNKLLEDFEKFTAVQIRDMGEFPEKDYHFLLQVLPYKFYHGVEHHDSTVICLGPGQELNGKELYTQLLGVSSHELFHAWNIIRIRPSELMPYKFNEEVAFSTGFVAEGFTTYYGDLFLARSGVFDQEAFFKELNTLFRRHFTNFGRLNYAVTDSSLDLWIDGYAVGTPDRKSSIYVEGAMIALCLDLMIRRKTESSRSLDDVMKLLWARYGKPEVGYTYDDVQDICEEVYGSSLEPFFKEHVKGTAPKNEVIDDLLHFVGCQLVENEAANDLEKYFGLRLSANNESFKIIQIAPDSIGEEHFSLNDEIIEVNGQKPDPGKSGQFGRTDYNFSIKRNYNDLSFTLTPGEDTWFRQYSIEQLSNPSESQREAFRKWCLPK